ncbi:MAG: uracil-xanthine permease, partial [Lachnospiraceae bacterium]|nr:uracil-xanthine permease [Lachnospiraceae bacterium]
MNNKTQQDAIYNAKELGTGKVVILGFQHMFAMFGATVLVPILTGLNVSTTLLFAGIGTLLFHLLTKGKVPAFLGSSFAFLGGYFAIAPKLEDGSSNVEMIPYACFGVACAGLLYLVMAALFKLFSARKVMKFFPPIVTGPIIIAIGLTLSQSAIDNCANNWLVAIVAIVVVILCNIFGKGMVKIIPILIGVIVSYIVGIIAGEVDFTIVKDAAWVGIPIVKDMTVLGMFGDNFDVSKMVT